MSSYYAHRPPYEAEDESSEGDVESGEEVEEEEEVDVEEEEGEEGEDVEEGEFILTRFQLFYFYLCVPFLLAQEHYKQFAAAHELTTEGRIAACIVSLYAFFYWVVLPLLRNIYNFFLFHLARLTYYYWAHVSYIIPTSTYNRLGCDCVQWNYTPDRAWGISSSTYLNVMACRGLKASERIGLLRIWWGIIKSLVMIAPDYYTHHRPDAWLTWSIMVPGFVFAGFFLASSTIRSKTRDVVSRPKAYFIDYPLVWGFCIADALIFTVLWVSLLLADSWYLKIIGIISSLGVDHARGGRPTGCYFFDVDLNYYYNTLGRTAPRSFIVWIIIAFCGMIEDWRKEALMPAYRTLEAELVEKDNKIQEMQCQWDARHIEFEEHKVVLEEWRRKLLQSEDERPAPLFRGGGHVGLMHDPRFFDRI